MGLAAAPDAVIEVDEAAPSGPVVVAPVVAGINRYELVARLALGHDHGRIGRAMGIDSDAVRDAARACEGLFAQVEEAVRQRFIAEADVEATTLAKAAAPDAMRNIITLAESCNDAKTKHAANRSVLEFAGTTPPKRIEISSGDKLLDMMTADELREFAAGKWPARFADQLRRIQVRKQLAQGLTIDVTPDTAAGDEVDEALADRA